MARLLSWATITNVTPTMHDLDAKSGPFKISKSEVGLSFHRLIYPPVYGAVPHGATGGDANVYIGCGTSAMPLLVKHESAYTNFYLL